MNGDKKFQLYKKVITNYLNEIYNLNYEQINNLIELYDLSKLAKDNPEYFYYNSPVYWAEYLIQNTKE